MKKKLVILALLLLQIFLLTNVKALDMTTLNLKRIKSLATPSGGYSVVQGGGVTDKYIVSVLENKKKEKNALIILNKDDYSYATIDGDNPILNRKYNKGNDLAFNSNTKEILILGDKKVYVLDENFKEKNTISLDKSYHAIAYNAKDDNYVLASNTKTGSKISIVDKDFKEVSSFNIKHKYTGESLTLKVNNIYYACYNKDTKENVIFIYDKEGKLQNTFLIPKSFNGVEYGELQNISFNGNKMILQFSKDNKVNYYNQVASNKISDTPIKIKLNDKYEDNKYVLGVYEDGNKIVAELPWSLLIDNEEQVCKPGDIVLLDANRIAIIYYETELEATKIGYLNYLPKDGDKIKELFGDGDLKITFNVDFTE